jgi:uncharacterized protein (DUF1810 family)
VKKKKCYHIFELDGGQCLKCRKTVAELFDEERNDIFGENPPRNKLFNFLKKKKWKQKKN